MVWIEIDDKVWALYAKSWALFGVKTQEELIRMLHRYLEESSMDVLDDAERHLISYEPEALMRREIGLMKEKETKKTEKERWKNL